MTDLATTRRSLHAAAELLLAGPQYALSGTIKLRPTPSGFGTLRSPDARVAGTDLVGPHGAVPMPGRSIADVAAEAGLTTRALTDVYTDGPGLGIDHVLHLDPAAAHEIAEAFRLGDLALADLAPDVERVLWPEHFDLGLALDEVNYGVSAGDTLLEVPYAYVGPWSRTSVSGSFWNAPFGAARPVAELPDLAAFFAEGRALSAPGR
jgi:hypothetical protein